MKTADFFVERLKAWGVKRIYGYSGDGINGVIGAIQRDGEIECGQCFSCAWRWAGQQDDPRRILRLEEDQCGSNCPIGLR